MHKRQWWKCLISCYNRIWWIFKFSTHLKSNKLNRFTSLLCPGKLLLYSIPAAAQCCSCCSPSISHLYISFSFRMRSIFANIFALFCFRGNELWHIWNFVVTNEKKWKNKTNAGWCVSSTLENTRCIRLFRISCVFWWVNVNIKLEFMLSRGWKSTKRPITLRSPYFSTNTKAK